MSDTLTAAQDTARLVARILEEARGPLAAGDFEVAAQTASTAIAVMEEKKPCPKIVEMLEACVAGGSLTAVVNLAMLYFHGLGVERDTDRALALCVRALESTDDEIRCVTHANLAQHYDGNYGAEPDPALAIYHYEEAGRLGHVFSAFNAGIMLIDHESAHFDGDRAVENFRRGAEGGETRSMVNLAALMIHCGLQELYAGEAMQLLEVASELGDPKARTMLAHLSATRH